MLEAARLNAAWAWESIYHELAPRVLGWLRLEQPDHAEDLLGETLLCIVRDINSFAGNQHEFQAWVFRIARNRMLDAARAASRRPSHRTGVPAAVIRRAEVAPDTAECVMRSFQQSRIVEMLSSLPEEQRTTIYLRFVLDASVAEAAIALGVSTAAVKMLQQRALRRLGPRIAMLIAG